MIIADSGQGVKRERFAPFAAAGSDIRCHDRL